MKVLLPSSGSLEAGAAARSIELQTHGSEVRFRNIFVREIPQEEARQLLASRRSG